MLYLPDHNLKFESADPLIELDDPGDLLLEGSRRIEVSLALRPATMTMAVTGLAPAREIAA